MANETFEEFMSKGWSWRDGGGKSVELDTTLTESGKAADAKATGDAIRDIDVVDPEKIKEAVDDFLVENPDVIDQTLSIKIEQNATDISALKQKHQKEMDRANKEIALLKKQAQGILYDFELVESEAYEVPVPRNAVTVKDESHSFADLVAIEGKNVKWNQLAKPTNSTAQNTRNGISVSHVPGSNLFHASGTIEQSSGYSGDRNFYSIFDTVNIIAGHKYALLSSCKYIGVYVYTSGHNSGDVNAGVQRIWTATQSGNHSISAQMVNGVQFSIDEDIILSIVDLTATPSYADVTDLNDPRIAWVKSYAEKHPEYNPGQLVSAEVEKVESVGKNLLKPENIDKRYPSLSSADGIEAYWQQSNDTLGAWFQAKSGETYTASVYVDGIKQTGNRNIWVWCETPFDQHLVSSNKTMMYRLADGTTVTNNRGDGYLAYYVGNTFADVSIDKVTIQIERGTTATAYSPYGVKDTIDLPTLNLRSAGAVADRADFLAYKVERKVGELKPPFTGINKNSSTATNDWLYYKLVKNGATSGYDIMCNKLSITTSIGGGDGTAGTCAISATNGGGAIYFNLKGLISENTAQATMAWLNSNDIHVYYPLAEPTTEPLDVPRSFVQAEPGGVIRYVNADEIPVPNAVEFTIDVKEGLNV